MTRRSAGDEGQAAVEVALVLPLLAVLALAILQVGLVVRDQVLVVHAAREGARAAAVSREPGTARAATLAGSGLDPGRLQVTESGRGAGGGTVTVVVEYRSPTRVPLVGPLVPDPILRGTATMLVEG